MTPAPRVAVLDRSRAAVLDAATRLLVADPTLSLSELAAAIGIGRTTLHRMFPTRNAVLVAIADDAIDHLERAYADAGLGDATADGPSAMAACRRVISLLVPLGPRLLVLTRMVELDAENGLAARLDELDRPLHVTVRRAQDDGLLDADVPGWWIVENLYAVVYSAWEQIERGRLAPDDAAGLATRTWLRGIGA